MPDFMDVDEVFKERIYLPSSDNGVEADEYLQRYVEREFPATAPSAVYSVPRSFRRCGERQAALAEGAVFSRLRNVALSGVWIVFFHGAHYAGRSFRSQREGRLVIREHDFVVFAQYNGKHFVVLMEVKSTADRSTSIDGLERTSDARVIKNNKRSAQHQLRDHLEILCGAAGSVQTHVLWPFLGGTTRDPRRREVPRWREDGDLHVFCDTIASQSKFDAWLLQTVLGVEGVAPPQFMALLQRFITLSCGVFADEINHGLMMLLTQEQLHLLHSDICQRKGALVVHGAAGTGKTLLVLRKLQHLHQNGQLNDRKRALYICYWPGIRCDFELKLEVLGIRQYVDTVRFYISTEHFLKNNSRTYCHIFMDEAEALPLAFDCRIIQQTLQTIYKRYHDANCSDPSCANGSLGGGETIEENLLVHDLSQWGELWFMVDTNQASLFLPKHSPPLLKTPSIVLTKVMRTTGFVFNVFKQFYSVPMPLLPKAILDTVHIPNITIGHHINGPPIYWIDSNISIDATVASIIIDLCATKGFKPNDLCVLPFLVNEKLIPESINRYIDQAFVENSFRPRGVKDVENFLKNRDLNEFLVAWTLRVKGLEFKVVIMAIDEDDFDCKDAEDRKKAYIIASRCTSMLIVVSNEGIRNDILAKDFKLYPFCLQVDNIH